jgi:hypothetical protein
MLRYYFALRPCQPICRSGTPFSSRNRMVISSAGGVPLWEMTKSSPETLFTNAMLCAFGLRWNRPRQ